MKQTTFLIALMFQFLWSNSQNDTIQNKLNLVENKISIVENKIDEVKRDQLNYSIEKNLLKETYSNNYEKINLFITIVLGIIGVLGYLGIKDINSIKKDYKIELEDLRSIKALFEIKTSSLDKEREKFDNEIKDILKQNEEQNKKIKILELRDKINEHLKNNQDVLALEYCITALDLAPEDVGILNSKGVAQCRLNQVTEALNTFEKAMSIDPQKDGTILNYTECLYFANDAQKAKLLIEQNKSLFEKRGEEGKLFIFFDLIEKYFTNNEEELKNTLKTIIDFGNLDIKYKYFKNWRLIESQHFVYHQPESEKKKILQNAIWYMDGQTTGRTVCQRLNIDIPN